MSAQSFNTVLCTVLSGGTGRMDRAAFHMHVSGVAEVQSSLFEEHFRTPRLWLRPALYLASIVGLWTAFNSSTLVILIIFVIISPSLPGWEIILRAGPFRTLSFPPFNISPRLSHSLFNGAHAVLEAFSPPFLHIVSFSCTLFMRAIRLDLVQVEMKSNLPPFTFTFTLIRKYTMNHNKKRQIVTVSKCAITQSYKLPWLRVWRMSGKYTLSNLQEGANVHWKRRTSLWNIIQYKQIVSYENDICDNFVQCVTFLRIS